eukprot:TRINITY_DN14372_c0_g1_i1.p1 TRINITY_DN14372_c0_g1~~TRINITY_DN14372_c0_g1_i1.p1  ORF type:complete len:487 (-),score=91.04 TRINITY_DN14372_c0_g1_i1:140-1411(-)
MDATEGSTGTETGRWKSGSAQKPITRGYVKEVLQAPTRIKKSTGGQRRPASETTTVGGANVEAEKCAVGDLLSTGGASLSDCPPTRAAANLQAALQQQSRESTDVEVFLAELKLDRYVGLFVEHGFDCMEVVQEMEESHMREIGMATGHILKLRKHLSELNGTAAPSGSAPAPKLCAGGAGVDASATSRRVSFGSTETREAKPTASSSGTTSEGLASGTFNEEESAASFQEALRAWRTGSRSETSDSPGGSQAVKPSSSSVGESSQKASSFSFWSSVGDSEMDLERARTPLNEVPTELCLTGTQVARVPEEQDRAAALGEEKLSCYHCYKQFYARHAVERQSPLPDGAVRRLCSEACAEKWKAAMELKLEASRKRQEAVERMKDMQRAAEVEGLATGPNGAGSPGVVASQATDAQVPSMAVGA